MTSDKRTTRKPKTVATTDSDHLAKRRSSRAHRASNEIVVAKQSRRQASALASLNRRGKGTPKMKEKDTEIKDGYTNAEEEDDHEDVEIQDQVEYDMNNADIGEIEDEEEDEEEEDEHDNDVYECGRNGLYDENGFFSRKRRRRASSSPLLGVRTPGKHAPPRIRKKAHDNDNNSSEGQDLRAKRSNRSMQDTARDVVRSRLVDDATVREALKSLPAKHCNERAAIIRRCEEEYFPQWKRQLMCGMNVMVYGFGSKRALLDTFARNHLTDGAVIVVDGCSGSSNSSVSASSSISPLKRMLAAAVASFYDEAHDASFSNSSHSRDSLLRSLRELMAVRKTPLYFVVHNIDAPSLRSSEARQLLEQLACISRVHFIASVDHLNASLMYDRRSSCIAFNWIWRELHTFVPYVDETRGLIYNNSSAAGGQSSLLFGLGASASRAGAVKGAGVVMRSLTPNARAIFSIIANKYIEEGNEENTAEGVGMTVESLYNIARERFLCSSEDTLRAHIR